MKTTILLLLTLVLAACDGDEQTTNFSGWEQASLTYSYPADQQKAVPLNAPLVLRFSHELTTDDPAAAVRLETDAGDPVPSSVEIKAKGRSLVVTPDEALAPGTDFVLRAGEQGSAVGNVEMPDDGVRFTTRARTEGAASAVSTDSEFRVANMIPDGRDWPLMDFSTLRLRFTQPIASSSVAYGDSVVLRDSAGQTVEAHAIASGHALTIDPVTDLQPGQEYELALNSDLKSTLGEALQPGAFSARTLTPKDSRPRETLVQKAAVSSPESADQCGASAERVSPLTGAAINCVPIRSVLLGNNSSSQQRGDVHAELAFVPNYPDVTPLRVPRGSLLRGSNVEVRVAGEVPAGIETGEISVKFVSDATGFLLPNPYSDAPEAPRQVRLFMDVAMNAENPEANGGLSQDLLHLELVGTAMVEDGKMVIDAVGVVEPEVLGQETAYGTLSFHMEGYRDQENAPQREPDTEAPVVQSWVPGDHADKHRPGDPIIVNFSEPMDRRSLARDGAMTLTRDGTEIGFDWRLDGASLVIHPDERLEFGDPDYELDFGSQLAEDLAGNPLALTRNGNAWDGSLSFSLPDYVGSGAPPLALTTYPGFPCAVANGTLDLANGYQGRCRGGESSDDLIPVMDLPANRSITVQFSQDMNPDSIALGEACNEGTFRVERIATDDSDNPQVNGNGHGVCAEAMDGRLEVEARRVIFTPDKPWDPGTLYRYELMSENQDFDASDCTRVQDQPASNQTAICSVADKGLQTAVLEAPAGDQGGPNLENYFRGAAPTQSVFQELRNLPTFDINANHVHEAQEPQPEEEPEGSGQYPVPPNATELSVVEGSEGDLLTDAKVGCDFESSCPDKKFLFLTGALNGDVVGYVPEEDAVKVEIYPTLITTSSVDTHAKLGFNFGGWLDLTVDQILETGAQVMRVRYAKDGNGDRTQPVTGWIRETPRGPVFEITLDVYLSAPYLHPEVAGITLTHDLYSYPLTLELSGPVTFTEDGRMRIEQINAQARTISVDISLDSGGNLQAAEMDLQIPAGGARINYTALPLKE